jgi:hypothetical protein
MFKKQKTKNTNLNSIEPDVDIADVIENEGTYLLARTYHENKESYFMACTAKICRVFEASNGNSSALECWQITTKTRQCSVTNCL